MTAWTEQRTFEAIESHEAACARGTHRRALAHDGTGEPVGLAWAPTGLAELPAVEGDRVVVMEGPDGSSLLFVPLGELAKVIGWAARERGVDPDTEDRFRALRSLDPGSVEPATSGLFDLISWLVARAPASATSESRVKITNEHDQAITLFIEPWAEEHQIEPNKSLEVIGSGPPGQLEVSSSPDGVTVYAWSGSTVRVLRDGVDVAVGSAEIPAP